MIDDPRGSVEYAEQGDGTTVVLVPGSFSTGSAWRGVITALGDGYRTVTTSLLGYGATAERRGAHDTSIEREAEVVEAVIERAGAPVHLVGHSFGGSVSLMVAIRHRVALSSLTVLEATAFDALRAVSVNANDTSANDTGAGDTARYEEVLAMRSAYARDFATGDAHAARRCIDFYGGDGSFDRLPSRMRDFVVATTATNLLDWDSALPDASHAGYGQITAPTLVVHGSLANQCVARAAEIVTGQVAGGELATIDGASHFMLGTHPEEVAALVDGHIRRVAVGNPT